MYRICFCCLAIWLGSITMALGQEITPEDTSIFGEEMEIALVSDPLEQINRIFFNFNDKFYFWMLKPVSQGYAYVVAENVRICVRSFLKNLFAPVRIVNNLLQGKLVDTGVETARFVINSTVGVIGLVDPAKNEFGLSPKEEDLGQTLGVYGFGAGIYICWPFLGPSNVRDTIGMIGDSFLSPVSYLAWSDPGAGVAVKAGKEVNDTSLTLGDYEDFKESALDPYISLRDAYRQYRQKKILDVAVGSDSQYNYSFNIGEKPYVLELSMLVESGRDCESVLLADDCLAQTENLVDDSPVMAMR